MAKKKERLYAVTMRPHPDEPQTFTSTYTAMDGTEVEQTRELLRRMTVSAVSPEEAEQAALAQCVALAVEEGSRAYVVDTVEPA